MCNCHNYVIIATYKNPAIGFWKRITTVWQSSVKKESLIPLRFHFASKNGFSIGIM